MKTFYIVLLALTTTAFGAAAEAKDKYSLGSPRAHGNRYSGGHHSNYGGGNHGGWNNHNGGWNKGWDRGHHGHHGFSSSFNFVVGLPLYRTHTYYRPYPIYYDYPRTVIVQQSSPPVYVQREVPAPQPAASDYWYYCPDSQTYYPYVQTCASEWLQVVPQTAPQ